MAYWDMYARSMTVGERKAAAEREVAKKHKAGDKLEPVVIEGRTIAHTFWGRSWCENLERYRDFDSRLPRGRSYVRSGSVIDLRIARGSIEAQVAGSRLYRVKVTIAAVDPGRWRALADGCAGSIDSMLELLKGDLDQAVMKRMCGVEAGLFPTPDEIDFICSCPDFASLCKHTAAVLYGVGARLDKTPSLLFELRHANPADLVTSAAQAGAKAGRSRSARTLAVDDDLAAMFGVELDTGHEDDLPAKKTSVVRVMKKAAATKKVAATKKKTAAKKTTKKVVVAKKTTKKVAAKKSARS